MNPFPPLPEIEALLSTPQARELQQLRLAVLRNITVEAIEPYLRYLAHAQGFNAEVKFGGFDQLMQEAVGGARDLLLPDLDAVLVFAYLSQLSQAVATGFAGLSKEQLAQETERLRVYFEEVVQGIRRQTDAMILWHGLEPPLHPALGIRDAQLPDGQSATVARLNDLLRTTLTGLPNAFLVDMAGCLARVGAPEFYDDRFWHLARAPYSRLALAHIAGEDFKFLRALKGRAKKCLVLDCDNTLWGGIVGEDGLKGIQLGKDHPGSVFSEFQKEIVSLFHRGVIIALCSKNNEADVWEVFDRHPDMLLKREHIAAWRINWEDKPANLRALAAELNIGLDSMVYVDDSEFEAGLVRRELPEVHTLCLSGEQRLRSRAVLASCGLFDAPRLTEEDRHRGRMYQADAGRRRARSQSTDLESYCRTLAMRLEIGRGDEFTIPRIAQQTQKTNQFNLTTRRYSEADIARFVASPEHDVLWVRVSDTFGDLGIVGVCILRYDGEQADIDTFLLSCRALGRGVEARFLAEALQVARSRGARTVTGRYLKTGKNAQTEGFYAGHGFQEIEAARTSDGRTFLKPLDNLAPPDAGHFVEIVRPCAATQRS